MQAIGHRSGQALRKVAGGKQGGVGVGAMRHVLWGEMGEGGGTGDGKICEQWANGITMRDA